MKSAGLFLDYLTSDILFQKKKPQKQLLIFDTVKETK